MSVEVKTGGQNLDDIKVPVGKEKDPVDQTKEIQKPSYESFQKALDEKKSAQAKYREAQDQLDAIAKATKAKEEEAISKSGDLQKMLDLTRDKLKNSEDEKTDLFGKLKQKTDIINTSNKVDSVLAQFPGKLKKDDYADLIKWDEVILDDDGKPEPMSVAAVAKKFIDSFGDDVFEKDTTRLPGGPGAPNQPLTYTEWLKLPVAEKRKRQKDVID